MCIHIGHIMSAHVLKLRAATGQGRLGATACSYTPNGRSAVQCVVYTCTCVPFACYMIDVYLPITPHTHC